MLDPAREVAEEVTHPIPDDPDTLAAPGAWAAFTHHGR